MLKKSQKITSANQTLFEQFNSLAGESYLEAGSSRIFESHKKICDKPLIYRNVGRMLRKHWIVIAIAGALFIIVFGIFQQIFNFNNRMIFLQEMKRAEFEATKVEYGQCIIKIVETNETAINYHKDIMALAAAAGKNLGQFQEQLDVLIGAQIIPQISPALRATVQRQIISCRNAYTSRVDLNLKPMYVEFNRLQRQFPYNIYNAVFFHWQTEELKMPHGEAGDEIFNSKKIKPLDLK